MISGPIPPTVILRINAIIYVYKCLINYSTIQIGTIIANTASQWYYMHSFFLYKLLIWLRLGWLFLNYSLLKNMKTEGINVWK